MPLYYYQSFTRAGKQVTGTIDAPSPQGAKELLQGQGLMPTSIEPAGSAQQGFSLSSLFAKKVDEKTVVMFTKQLGVLLRSGVPLLQAFELLTEQFEQPFQGILISVKEGIKGGEAMADQLAQHPNAFSNVYIQLVRAGEASGKLDTILERLVEYMVRASETKKKVKKAMSGPLQQLGMIGAVVVGMLTYLVPRMAEMFTKTGQELPGPTILLMAMSDLMVNYFLWVVGGGIVCAFLFMRWKSTESGRYMLDDWTLRIPMFSYFSKTKAVVQFSQTLGMLLESGVNLSEALDIVCEIVENKVLTQKLKEARDNIIKEGKIARYLKETGLFPSMASYMISTGEESGKLAEMLLSVGRDYDEELIEITESLTGKISPIMTILTAAIVMFIVLAIFMPIMEMGDMAGV